VSEGAGEIPAGDIERDMFNDYNIACLWKIGSRYLSALDAKKVEK
jgi:hypothetical protein